MTTSQAIVRAQRELARLEKRRAVLLRRHAARGATHWIAAGRAWRIASDGTLVEVRRRR